jgi:hypothetical protein
MLLSVMILENQHDNLATALGVRTVAPQSQLRSVSTLWVLALLLSILQTHPTQAEELTINDFALTWVRGQYGQPLLCNVGEMTQNTLRPFMIKAGPRKYFPPVNKIRIRKIGELETHRCYSELSGQEEKDIEGTLYIRLERKVPADLVGKEIREMLAREKGFTFHVVSGALRVRGFQKESGDKKDPEDPESPAAEPAGEIIDFTGGEARFREYHSSEDVLRLLQDFPQQRKLELTLTSKTGHKFRFPLVKLD